MVDVILIVPPIDSNYSLLDDPFAERLGIGYLASYLLLNGFSVEIFHCPAQKVSVEKMVEIIVQMAPCVVGVSLSFLRTDLAGTIKLSREIRARNLHIPIVVGGHPVTLTASNFVAKFPEISAVVRGEGEVTMSELVKKIKGGMDWTNTQGITFMANNRVYANPARPLIDDLDQLPFPQRYLYNQMTSSNKKYSRLISSRGCYGKCSFCSINSFYFSSPGRRWRARSPKNIVDEMRFVINQWQIRMFQFEDDNFIGVGRRGRDRAYEFGKELISRKVFANYHISCRAQDVDEQLLSFLKNSGLVGVFVGLESGVQRSLDFYNKMTTVAQNEHAVNVLRRLDLLSPQPGFIMFDPFTTPEEIKENIAFLRRTGLLKQDISSVLIQSKLSVFPGTPVVGQIEKAGLFKQQVHSAIEDYICMYEYKFADQRTQLIYEFIQETHQPSVRLFFQKGRYGDLQTKYSLVFQHIASTTGLSFQQLSTIPSLLFSSIETIPRWLMARSELFVSLIEQAADTLITKIYSEKLAEELKNFIVKSIDDLDKKYLQKTYVEFTKEIISLLTCDTIEFTCEGKRYSVSGITAITTSVKA